MINDAITSAASSDAFAGRLVLVEDDPLSRGVLALLLESAGWRVAGAGDGRTGFRLARRLSPDVVVTDLRMPGMSGIRLAQRISEIASERQPPVVAITSDASDLRDAAVRSGLFAQVLTKPVAPHLLLETVKEAFMAQPADRRPG